MNAREEFLHAVANGLLRTEYSERFLQEMSDHIEDAEHLYALKENGGESEQNALRDIGNPKRTQKLFNHVMKYRNKISVLVECLLLMILAVPVSYAASTLPALAYTHGIGIAVAAFVAEVAVITLFVVFALRRVQKITFGEMNLLYPALALFVGLSFTVTFTWIFASAMQVDAATWKQVVGDMIESGAVRLIAVILGYMLMKTAPWEKTSAWKKWQAYSAAHQIHMLFNIGWLLVLYPIASTVLLWLGVDSRHNGNLALQLFQAPRLFVEQLMFGLSVQTTSPNVIILTAFVIACTVGVLIYLMVKDHKSQQPVSPIKCAAVVYGLCLLLASPLQAATLANDISWYVPFENIQQTQLKKQFSVLSRFASYVQSFHDPVDYAIRYRTTNDELVIAKEHPHAIVAVRDIRDVHTYTLALSENQKRITDYSEDTTLPTDFECITLGAEVISTARADRGGKNCSSVLYHGQKIFVANAGGEVYVQRIVRDSAGRFALVLMRENERAMNNNQVYLIELPQ